MLSPNSIDKIPNALPDFHIVFLDGHLYNDDFLSGDLYFFLLYVLFQHYNFDRFCYLRLTRRFPRWRRVMDEGVVGWASGQAG